MNINSRILLSFVALATPAVGAPVRKVCGNVAFCTESSDVAVSITDVRSSQDSNTRFVALNAKFTNKTNHTLTLGYDRGSPLIVDDQGNRYALNGAAQGIPSVANGNLIDASYMLQAGESADARFEFSLRPGAAIVGTRYDLNLTIRELIPLPANQVKFGKAMPINIRSLQASTAHANAAPTTTRSPSAAPEASADLCKGAANCYAAGPFVAEVTRVTPSDIKNWSIKIQTVEVRFRNVSSHPIVLAHDPTGAVIIDDQGNRYHYNGRVTDRVKGIGLTQYGQADPSFALRPGESRTATFEQQFQYRQKILGTSLSFDMPIVELEVTPSQQSRAVGKYAVSFHDLTAGTHVAAGASIASGGDESANPVDGAIEEANRATEAVEKAKGALDGLKGLFGKKGK